MNRDMSKNRTVNGGHIHTMPSTIFTVWVGCLPMCWLVYLAVTVVNHPPLTSQHDCQLAASTLQHNIFLHVYKPSTRYTQSSKCGLNVETLNSKLFRFISETLDERKCLETKKNFSCRMAEEELRDKIERENVMKTMRHLIKMLKLSKIGIEKSAVLNSASLIVHKVKLMKWNFQRIFKRWS